MATTTIPNNPNSTSSTSLPLLDRVAIVTGSSRGIGKAIAIHLASLGAKLVLNYVSNKQQADAVADEINSSWKVSDSTPRAIVVQADVSDPAHVKLLFDEAERFFGCQVHVFVNNAGIADKQCPIADTSLEDFDRTFRGAFLCCKEAANRLKRGGGGRIIVITSAIVVQLQPTYGTYAATKAAVETMVKILSKELRGTSITANCVAPGPIPTDMLSHVSEELFQIMVQVTPLERLGQSEDVAPVVGFLATDAGEWINGQVIRVTGGLI